MLKRSSSFSRRDRKLPEKKSSSSVKSITRASTGCMSGLFQFFQYHHTGRSRKRLASGANKGKNLNSSEKQAPLLETKPLSFDLEAKSVENKELMMITGTALTKTTLKNELRQRRSCEDAPRSPTITSDIRRTTLSVGSSTEVNSSPRCPPAIIAKLMGLEENVPATPTKERSPYTASEKRRRLLGALEQCDEDLRTIKRIIDAVREAETQKGLLPIDKEIDVVKSCIVQEKVVEKKKCFELVTISTSDHQLQQSPVSVLEAISSPRYKPPKFDKGGDQYAKRPRLIGISVDDKTSLRRRTLIDEHLLPCKKGKLLDKLVFGRRLKSELETSSKAMVENVVEVLEEGLWEQKWLASRIYLGLEDALLQFLLEELVTELIGRCCHKLTTTCRKRLLF